MHLRKFMTPYVCSFLVASALTTLPLFAQESSSSSQAQNKNDSAVEGTVVSSSSTAFVVRSNDNQFHLFTYDSAAINPRTLAAGNEVEVASNDGDQPNARQATEVAIVDQRSGSGSSSSTASGQTGAPLPQPVRKAEGDIQREAKRWRMGVRAGVGLDPELVSFGVHSQMGPIFSRNVFFRPNAEFAWGEITDMVGLNLEAIYRMPVRARDGTWNTYIGAGPALNFIHQSFKTQASQARDIQFGNFQYQTGLNVLMGVQHRNGTFFEVKTALYSQPAPVLRLIVGKNF